MSAVLSREIEAVESMTVGKLLDEYEVIRTKWSAIVGGLPPKDRNENFHMNLSAIICVIAEQRLKDRGISV